MKKIAIVITLFTTMFSASAQTVNNNAVALPRPADVLQLKETGHNFGKIPQGRPAVYVFEIVNTGSIPLKLDNVQASCGCTTPEWSGCAQKWTPFVAMAWTGSYRCSPNWMYLRSASGS